MTRHRTLPRLLAALLATAAVLVSLTACGSGGDLRITARFDDSAGLFEGNDVGVLGVRVGEVESITPRGDHVDVELRVEPDVKIPADAGAVVVSRSVATDRYVELTPVYESGPVMQSGTILQTSRTRSPVEFDELQATLKRITQDLTGPDGKATPVNDLLDVSARTLDGNGEAIATGLKDLADVLENLNESSGDAVGTIENLDSLTSALAENDRLVRRFTSQVADATAMLDDEHESIEDTFNALAAMVRAVTKFSREHRVEVGEQVEDFAAVAASMVDHREELERLVENLPLMAQNVGRAIDDEGRLTFRTRPGDLLPNEAAFQVLCSNLPEGSCDGFKAGATTLFQLLATFAGVHTP